MQVKNSYYIKRNGVYIWLNAGIPMQDGDELIEVRPMLIADEGKTLWKDGEEVGQCVWLRNGDVKENYEERDIPPEPEEEVNG